MLDAKRRKLRREVGRRLYDIRAEKALSQKGMGVELDLPWRTYQNHEIGLREISGDVLRRLYQRFGIDPAWVLWGVKLPRVDADYVCLQETTLVVEQRIANSKAKISPKRKANMLVKAYRRAMDGDELTEGEIDDWIELARS